MFKAGSRRPVVGPWRSAGGWTGYERLPTAARSVLRRWGAVAGCASMCRLAHENAPVRKGCNARGLAASDTVSVAEFVVDRLPGDPENDGQADVVQWRHGVAPSAFAIASS